MEGEAGLGNGLVFKNGAAFYDPKFDQDPGLNDPNIGNLPVAHRVLDEDGHLVVDPDALQVDAALIDSVTLAEINNGGGDARVADQVAMAIEGGHFKNLGEIRGILGGLFAKGRAGYKIFSLLPAITTPYILDLIKKLGGKNFGDLMLEVFYGEHEDQVAKIAADGGFEDILVNDSFYVETDVSRRLEAALPDLLDDMAAIIGKYANGSPIAYFNPEPELFRRYLIEKVIFSSKVLKIVDEVYTNLIVWDIHFDQEKYRFRGSMGSEDWLDTAVAGVSPSGSYDGSLNHSVLSEIYLKKYSCNPKAGDKLESGEQDLWNFLLRFLLPYMEFLFHKKMSQLAAKREELKGDEKKIAGFARYKLDEDEDLGLQVAPEIQTERHVVAVIDEDDVVRLDLNMVALNQEDLLIRVEVDEHDNIVVHHGFNFVEYEETLARYPLFGVPERVTSPRLSYLSGKQILAIVKIMRLKKNFYEFPVDGEFCIDNKNRVYDVQTRISPDVVGVGMMESESLNGYTCVAESNFGLGQKFFQKGRLVSLPKIFYTLGTKELDDLVAHLGDLSKYILLLDKPLANYLFLLQRLAFQKANVFGGVVDTSRGIALTHTSVSSGATNFLRTNIPAMGRGGHIESLFELMKMDEASGFSISEVDVVMKSDDGKTVQMYVPAHLANQLLRKKPSV